VIVVDASAAVSALLNAGARRSELLALRWSDIDYKGGRITLARGSCSAPRA
jgi:integrase